MSWYPPSSAAQAPSCPPASDVVGIATGMTTGTAFVTSTTMAPHPADVPWLRVSPGYSTVMRQRPTPVSVNGACTYMPFGSTATSFDATGNEQLGSAGPKSRIRSCPVGL